MGHSYLFTLDKVWRNKENTDKNDGLAAKDEEENAFYEINIDPIIFISFIAFATVPHLGHSYLNNDLFFFFFLLSFLITPALKYSNTDSLG